MEMPSAREVKQVIKIQRASGKMLLIFSSIKAKKLPATQKANMLSEAIKINEKAPMLSPITNTSIEVLSQIVLSGRIGCISIFFFSI